MVVFKLKKTILELIALRIIFLNCESECVLCEDWDTFNKIIYCSS